MEVEKGVKGELKEVRGEEESGIRGMIVACWFGLANEWYSGSRGRPLGRADWVVRRGVVRDGGSCCCGSETWGDGRGREHCRTRNRALLLGAARMTAAGASAGYWSEEIGPRGT